jgi:hypothetical protein
MGTFTYKNGNSYIGEFKDGKMDGHGTFINSNGKKIIGEWKKGKPL